MIVVNLLRSFILIRISIVAGELSKRFQRYPNYAISPSSNLTSQCSSEEACINTCLNNPVCTAISMNNGAPGRCKSGKINRYGRVLLVQQMEWTTWIRGMRTCFFIQCKENDQKICLSAAILLFLEKNLCKARKENVPE